MLSFVTTLVWIAGRGSPRAVRIAAATILMIMPIGIIRDWRYPALANQHFEQYAASFERMPAGTELRIPINPSGWSMRLVKKAPGSR
jgi:alkanesulfonate monooxygenase SsuD/methylene tetrahydromethanopterin reductase-like flavin-dependent oxidoreductase (luciferase family)